MGNNITYELEDFDDYVSDDSSLSFDNADHLSFAYSMVLSQIVRQDTKEMPPVIRKKPDLRIFRVSFESSQGRVDNLFDYFSSIL